MAHRSQAHLRRTRGYDSMGRTAYELGEESNLTPAAQRTAALAAGYSPPAVPPTWTLSASKVGLNVTLTIDFSAAPSTTARVNWGDGTVTAAESMTTDPDTALHTYAATGTYRIEVTIGAVSKSIMFVV